MSIILTVATFSVQAQKTLSTLFWTTPNIVFDDQEFKINIQFQGSDGTIYTLKASSDEPIMNNVIHLTYNVDVFSPQIPYGPKMARASYTIPCSGQPFLASKLEAFQ